MSWSKTLTLWRNQHLGHLRDSREDFYEVINQSDELVVTIGDSWTWGDSLDPELRLQQVYGSLISNAIGSDWINVGCRGWSNSYILEHGDYLIDLLKNTNYKKIYFVITLTENARDVKTANSFVYDYINLFEKTGPTTEFYDCLTSAIEQFWIHQIKNMLDKIDSRYSMIIGQNFVWHQNLYNDLTPLVTVLNQNWIECLADAQQTTRPVRTNLVTGWIFDTMNSVHNIVKCNDTTEFKKWALPKIELANQVNKWLDSSIMNSKEASKHPTAEGHRVWADYILKRLQHD